MVIPARKCSRLDVTHLPADFKFTVGDWGLTQLDEVMHASLLSRDPAIVPTQRDPDRSSRGSEG
jgi:hypothetical protein